MTDAREEVALAAARAHRLPAGPAATGSCLWCDEPVASGVRWCSSDCRDDWERRARAGEKLSHSRTMPL